MVDRHAWLDAQPWLSPRGATAEAGATLVFDGHASLSLSLREQFAAAHEPPPSSPLGAAAPDAAFLFFAVTPDCPDATQLRTRLFADAHGGVVLELDGRTYSLDGAAIRHISARSPEGSSGHPPFVSVLFERVTLTLTPAPGRAWAVEAPALLAAANSMECARTAGGRAAPACAQAEDAAALAGSTASALRQHQAAVAALAASCGTATSTGVFHTALAVEALSAACAAIRAAPDGPAASAALALANEQVEVALADATPTEQGQACDEGALERLQAALQRADECRAAELAAALAPSIHR